VARLNFSIALALLVTGCDGFAAAAPTENAQRMTSSAYVSPAGAVPETCNKSVRLKFKPRGGSFALPRCGGWTGTMMYPPVIRRTIWGITTSTTNDFGAPGPPSGIAIFYMQMYLRHPGGATFPNGNVTDTVANPMLTPGHTYTLNVYRFLYNNQCPSSQCTWSMNIGSPQPGTHSITFVSPLNGASIGGGPNLAPVWQFVLN
jgi:hypothetical protein